MDKKPEFHGSDIEKISKYYHLPKENIVNFGANVNPLGLSLDVKRELAANLDVLTRYPDRNYTSLKETLGEYCQVDPSHIVVGNGSTELISLLIHLRHPRRALVLGPTYSEYARELSLVGGAMDVYHLKEADNFVLNIQDFLSSIHKETDLLILCNPNNPTSSALSKGELGVILDFCQKQNLFMMIDETYVEFAPDPEAISATELVPRYDNLMIIRGVSKFFAAPGLRFGYGLTSNKDFLQGLLANQNPWSLNSIGAYAGELMLKDASYIQRTRELIASERIRLCRELDTWNTVKVYPSYANFILLKILKEGLTSFDVFETAIRQGLMIRDCSSFQSLEGEFIRFCILNPEDNDRLMACLKQMLVP